MSLPSPPMAFRALSALIGADPMQIQGAGGNTSWKVGDAMWVKASGLLLADAMEQDVFVPVNLAAARAEADGAGDGTCRAAVVECAGPPGLRPSIETTFHAALEDRCVVHTHSVAALAHATSPEGLAALRDALSVVPHAVVPYAMPGRALTREIMARAAEARVLILTNHGLIVRGDDAAEVAAMLAEVEARLELAPREAAVPDADPPDGFAWMPAAFGPHDPAAPSLYPDHVVFLGPGLPAGPEEGRPACVVAGGLAIRTEAGPAPRAMARCLADVLARVPDDWTPTSIGAEAEAELAGWDAEAYRQKLAAGRT